jgi:hypothetical protein
MEKTVLIFLIAIVIIILGLTIYFIRDYLQYKTQIDTQFSVTQSLVNSEQKDRLASLKYVVDQVNNVNDDISSTLVNEGISNAHLADNVHKKQQTLLNSLNSAFKFNDDSGNSIPLLNVPTSVNPNLALLNNITATMGLTAKDLQPNGNSVQLCSKSDPSKCIQFPDKNGNTYLTDFGNGGIILDSAKGTTINNGVNLTGGVNMNATSGAPSGTINPGPNQLILESPKVGVGKLGDVTPHATLHVSSQNASDNILELSSATPINRVISVSPNGTITIYSGNSTVGTIAPDPKTNGLQITANTLTVNGRLKVTNGITDVLQNSISSAGGPSGSY